MAETVRKLVLGDALSPSSRSLFKQWLLSNATADARFRAGVPPGWKVADKGGTGEGGVTNDIGVLYGPDGRAIVLTAFTSGSTKARGELESGLAEVSRLVVAEFDDR